MSSDRVVIGVDVGGTNIDAVALVGGQHKILSTFKSPTTADPSEGIMKAIDYVVEDAHLTARDISSVVIGTTHFINAVVTHDGSKLDRVGVIRLGSPYTAACPPFIDIPLTLRALVEGPFLLCKGGLQINGDLIGNVDECEIVKACQKIKEKGVTSVVITGIYSVLDQDENAQEYQAARIVEREMPGVRLVCSRDVGTDGLVEREGAAILNASLLRFAKTTLVSFQKGIRSLGLECPIFLTQNDGTLCTLAKAAKLPIRTFSSGATNSMRGASYLAALNESMKSKGKPVIVIDIGGTTTDVGVLMPSGFPRQAAAYVNIAGVRTCFSMPDVLSIGLGGGSFAEERDGRYFVGPKSTGYRLLTEGIVFGGNTVTATDISVSAGRATNVGDATKVAGLLSEEQIQGYTTAIRRLLEKAISTVKTWPEPATVLIVGGGAILAPDTLEGASEIVCPKYFDCANAVGAAVARVSGEIDTIKNLLDISFSDAVIPLKELAIKKAVDAGAKESSVIIVELANFPVQYVATGATKVKIRAAGDLDYDRVLQYTSDSMVSEQDDDDSTPASLISRVAGSYNPYPKPVKTVSEWTLPEVESYRPYIGEDKIWELSELDLHWIGEGCGVLGVGGGGSTFNIMIMCREIMRKGGRIRVRDFDDMEDDDLVGRCCMMGSPSVSEERLQAGPELLESIRLVTQFLGIPLEDIKAIISDEIGGGNGVQPALLASSAYMDVPIIDADLMGRAYPFLFASLPVAYGIPGFLPPVALVDAMNNRTLVVDGDNRRRAEEFLRVVCDKMGSMGMYSSHPLKVSQIREYGVLNSYSQAWRLGRAMHLARLRNDFAGLPESIFKLQTGRVLFRGKCTEVYRHIKNAWTFGHLRIRPLEKSELEGDEVNTGTNSLDYDADEEPVKELYIEFQNEYICCTSTRSDGSTRLHAIVPDLITILDTQSGVALGTHEVRYGLRMTVIALACDPKWTTPEGLAYGGPEVWNLGHPYKSAIGAYHEPSSVIREYGPGGESPSLKHP